MSHVNCPQCHHVIKLSEKISGRKVKCKCGRILRMPKHTAPASVQPDAGSDSLIRYRCPSCNKRLAMPSKLAGKRSRCPCGVQVRVPSPNTPSVAPVPLTPGLEISLPGVAPVGGNDPFANDNQPLVELTPILEPASVEPIVFDDPYAVQYADVAKDPLASDNPFVADDPFAAANPLAANDPFAVDDPFAASLPIAGNDGFMDATSGGTVSNVAPAYRKPGNAKPKRIVNQQPVTKKKDVNMVVFGEILAGLAMMVGASIWFFVALNAGWIFYYPPILFITGMVTVARGCWSLFSD